MSMTWGEIRDLYMRASGGSVDAVHEGYQHLTQSYRKLCALMELPELHVPDSEVTANSTEDFVEIDPDVYAVDYVINVKDGNRLDPEPGGMRGRSRYFESGETRPPLGDLNFYQRRGHRIYLRDTPRVNTLLKISFRLHPPPVTEDMLDEHPITPQEYDMALATYAAGSYFTLHPPEIEGGMVDYQRGQNLMGSAFTDVDQNKKATTEENLDRRQWTTQRGYSFNLGGR